MKTLRLTLGLLLACAGCSYSTFTDLSRRAPAARLSQEGEVRSASFADGLAGIERSADETGGVLAIAGNANPSFSRVSFDEESSPATSALDTNDIVSVFGDPKQLASLAPAPGHAPFVLAGSQSVEGNSSVRLINLDSLKAERSYASPKLSPTGDATVEEFGLTVGAADLGDNVGQRDDLVIGARDVVVLMRAKNGGKDWPEMDEPVIVGGKSPDCMKGGRFTVVASGNIDSSPEDEVVAAAPDEKIVVVISGVSSCLADAATPCTSYVCLQVPGGAGRFGAALLVADVDGDNTREIVVGDPDANSVYVYSWKGTEAQQRKQLGPNEGGFGQALAYGKVEGSTRDLLVVSAPSSTVAGVDNAGRLYLYDKLEPIAEEGVALVSPEEDTWMGRRLALLPFRAASQAEPFELLVAGGRDTAFVFFANLTPDHRDIRKR